MATGTVDIDIKLPLLCDEAEDGSADKISAANITTDHSVDKDVSTAVNHGNKLQNDGFVGEQKTKTAPQGQMSAARQPLPKTSEGQDLHFEEKHFDSGDSPGREQGNTDQRQQLDSHELTLEQLCNSQEAGKRRMPFLRSSSITIASVLKIRARRSPRKNAFVFLAERQRKGPARSIAVTCEQLYNLAVLYAVHLRYRYGIQPQDIVCNTLPNCLERVVVDMGVILANGILLDAPRYVDTDEQMEQFCDYLPYLDVKLVVSARADPFSRLVVIRAQRMGCRVCYSFISDISADEKDLRRLLREALPPSVDPSEAESLLPTVTEKDMAVLWSTRGRRGRPRVIAHTHKSVLQIGSQMDYHLLRLREDDVYYTSAGLGSLYGFPSIFLLKGVTTLVDDKTQALQHCDVGHIKASKPQPLLSFNTLIYHGCTVAFFTTHDIEKYQDAGQIRKCCLMRKLTRVVLAGDQVKTPLVKALRVSVTEAVLVAYCMKEVGLVAHSLSNQELYKEGDGLKLMDDVGVTSTRFPMFSDCTEFYYHGTLTIKKPYTAADLGDPPKGGVFRQNDQTETSDLVAVYPSRHLAVIGIADKKTVAVDIPTFIRTEFEFQIRKSAAFISDASIVVLPMPNRPGHLKMFVCVVLEPSACDTSPVLHENPLLCSPCWFRLEKCAFGGTYTFREFPKTMSGFPDRKALTDIINMMELGQYKIRPQARLPGDDWFCEI